MTETEKIMEQLKNLAPQAQMLTQLWEPMEAILGELMAKIGITVKAGKIIYLKNQNRIIYGIEFTGPQEALEKLLEAMKGAQQEE